MPFGYEWLDFAEIISAISVPILTLFLTLLYLKMVRIQERQTEILDRQESLIEAEHLPVIQIGFIDCAQEEEGQESLLAQIKNSGNGIAKNLKVGCKFYIPGDDFPNAETDNISIQDKYLSFSKSPMWRLENEQIRTGGGDIVPPDVDEYYQGQISCILSPRRDGPFTIQEAEHLTFKEVLSLFLDEGINSLTVYFFLYFEDIVGNDYEMLITGRTTELKEGIGLEWMLEEVNETRLMVGRKPPDNILMRWLDKLVPDWITKIG